MTADEALREMVAKGVSAEAIMVIAKLIADAEVTEKTRAAARARMRHVRERSRTLQNGSEQVGQIEEKKERKRKKTFMPDAWHPAIAPEDAAEFQRFTNYCKANAKVYADWDAAWRNWQTSPYRSNGGQRNGARSRQRSLMEVFDDIAGRGGPEPLDRGAGSATILSLPKR